MKNKIKRFATIKEIISTTTVSCQDDLLRMLAERGFQLTQATLSRDLKQMKVAKTPDVSGEYIYRLPTEVKATEDHSVYLSNNVTTVDFSGNNVVIHTRSGYASSLAYEIDERIPDIILGTVAGEDTIIGVIKEGISKDEVFESLSRFVPTLRANQH
ncbi:MAG: arginine repressor [Paludibacteraceae bacterium]|nr:arginine repressor [Candidatus Physcocola equi]MCQ2234181.1 arginine repressor [Paludibacteraceae bacterium]